MKFLKALSVFSGTIIGVGIFGLPYVSLKAGFPIVFLYFLILTGAAIIIHLMYGEISLAIKAPHRLPGAVGIYMGPRWKNFTFFTVILGLSGALLAYLIVGGKFLTLYFSPYLGGSDLIYTLIFWAIGTFLIFKGIKSISAVELILLLVFFLLLGLFLFLAFPFINADNFKNIDLSFFSFPYGVVLFALWGSNMVPEVKEMLGKDKDKLKGILVSGILLAAAAYLLFIYIVLGAAGQNTSKEAISGMVYVLGDGVIKTGFLFGIITCFTSFLTLGLTLKKVLWYDLKINSNLSWFVACFLPISLFFMGLRGFIDVIGLTGAVAVGLTGVIIVFMYKEFLKKRFSRKMNSWFYLLPVLFVLGIVSEILYFIILR